MSSSNTTGKLIEPIGVNYRKTDVFSREEMCCKVKVPLISSIKHDMKARFYPVGAASV